MQDSKVLCSTEAVEILSDRNLFGPLVIMIARLLCKQAESGKNRYGPPFLKKEIFNMSEIIDKDKQVKMGYMIMVKNTNKKPLENDKYISIQVEDEDGQNERCLLFTEIEISDMEKISSLFLMNNMKYGRLYKFNINKNDTNIVKVVSIDGRDIILRISNSQLKSADFRRIRNPEDLTKKGFLTDIVD